MKYKLEKAIQKFAKKHPEWSTKREALDQCSDASLLFLNFLSRLGLEKSLRAKEYVFFVGDRNNPDRKNYTIQDGISTVHAVVSTRTHFIDWTARQYNWHLPFPYILPRKKNMRGQKS